MTGPGDVVTVNMGSSGLKVSLWDRAMTGIVRGAVEGIGTAPRLVLSSGEDHDWGAAAASASPADLLPDVLGLLERGRGGPGHLAAIGHRIVHGGEAFEGPVLVDDAALDRIAALSALAPLHQPHGIAGIRACRALRPGVPQVAAFDTTFHRTLPPDAARYAVPPEWEAAGVRRYGFHGLSFAHVAHRLAESEPALRRVVVAHLGSGASLCALADGRSVDTTMGFTPLDGLVMGTRPGLLDPGIVVWAMRERGLGADAIEDILHHRCGLLGASGGLSADMRVLEASDDPRAAGAISLFVHRVAREIGAMAASLGGLDALVFAGGIGEGSPAIRARIVGRCRWLGATLDPAANERGQPGRISAADGPLAVLVVPADEEREIASAAHALVRFPLPSTPPERPTMPRPKSGRLSLLLADVDGTLVTKDKILTPRAVKAVAALRDRGVRFAITSGRPPRGMAMLTGPLGLDTPIAGFNGGLLVRPDATVMESRNLSRAVAEKAYRIIVGNGLNAWVYAGNDWFLSDLGGPHVEREAWTVRFAATVVDDASTKLDGATKIVGVSDDPDRVAACERALKAALGDEASAARSQPYYLDVTHPDANKGFVVGFLARHLGIPAAEIATIGDMPNDVLMFRASGFSIAMGNAGEEVRKAADAVTDSYDDEGFAKAVETYFLDGDATPGASS